MRKDELAAMIDHTQLKAFAGKEQIKTLCQEAAANHFASVCVNPCHVSCAAGLLRGTGVKVCTVIGFPLGANTSAVKAFEAKNAVANGAQECDMVINIGALKDGNIDLVESDIREVVKAAEGALVKVIIETCYLTDEEKVLACQAASRAGADFVKTSTGFGTGGATPHDVALMRRSIPDTMKVKAAGGIHNFAEAMAVIEAGASRIGASAGIAIISEAE
ncbi:MAG: deoxyribose-phosphate aldolase [Fretibacterium sp.]|nr:deoxyribose-phosphate aldolase [Fretibacterium sp.]